MRLARSSLPVLAVAALCLVVYKLVQDYFKVQEIDENVRDVKADVQGVKKTTADIKNGVKEVKDDTVDLKKGVQEVKQEVQEFRQETKGNFEDVRADIIVAKKQLLQDCAEKEKNLTALIKHTKGEIKSELKEAFGKAQVDLKKIQVEVKKAATKRDIEFVSSRLDVMRIRIDTVKEQLVVCIEKSEARQKQYIKSLARKIDKMGGKVSEIHDAVLKQ